MDDPEQLNSLSELWESQAESHEILEAVDSEVDGVHVLAKVRGPAFFPDTVSGNQVHYPISAWKNAINEERFQKRLQDRLVYGTIGHKQVLNDQAIQEGKFSHIVTDVSINEETGVGEAEYLVLGTPTGRVLNTVLRAKSKLRVSTKAKGLLESQVSGPGRKSVNPDMFFLERIDFVLEPGYDQALPDLIESLTASDSDNVLPNENIHDKGDNMDPTQKLIEVLESSIGDLSGENKVKTETITDLQKQLGEIGGQVTALNESKAALEAKLEESETKLTNVEEALASYKELGTAEEVSEALDKSDKAIDSLRAELQESVSDISESLMADEEKEVLAKYRDFGTVEELQELAESADKLADQFIAQRLEGLAKDYEVSESVLKKWNEKGLDIADIEESLKELQAETKTRTPVKRELSSKDFQTRSQDIEESAKEPTAPSLSHKLMKSLK